MRLILKLKNKIVSIGLIPIIITLIGLHFFPNTIMLGTGFVLSIIMLIYNIVKMKDLNFFLLLGALGIGLCFFLRLIWGYKYVPLNTITPTLELSLLAFTFLHNTAPEVYNGIIKYLGIKNCFSYKLETKIIIILSSIHLLFIYFISYFNFEWGYQNRFIIFNVIPVSIYIICFIINVTGIRIAAKFDPRYKINSIIRIAIVYNGKIFLSEKEGSVWDLSSEIIADAYDTLDKYEKKAVKAVKKLITTAERPRLIIRYTDNCECGCKINVSLYILPLKNKENLKKSSGHFFSFDEIEKHPELYSKNLVKEFISLKNAAEMWKDFYSTCK